MILPGQCKTDRAEVCRSAPERTLDAPLDSHYQASLDVVGCQ
jgi:hypothetical protein